MTRPGPLALLLAIGTLAAPGQDQPEDLLRFTNGDQLHGRFAGIGERGRLLWQRADVEGKVDFETSKLRQVVLRGGRPEKGIEPVSHARMVGGDRLPGTIVSLDDQMLVLDTPFAGRLSLPRNRVDVLAPQPFGGHIRYAGPFRPDGWRILDNPETEEPPAAEEDSEEPPRSDAEPWVFARTAWYSTDNVTGRPLVLDDAMPDSALLRFTLNWRNQVAVSIAFHADFDVPQPEDDDDKPPVRGTPGLPYQFGNCYVLQLQTHFAMMYRCGFDDDGRPFTTRLQNTSNIFRLPLAGEARVELRCDRASGRILLFIDDEFRMQWDESEGGYGGGGGGFGFLLNSSSTPLRVSDVLVGEWNGMVDSARSMHAPDRDVVLLTNGTDRFSGRISAVRDDHVELAGNYAEMRIPLSRVAEIHFARDSLAEAAEPRADAMIVLMHPLGRISGSPLRAGGDTLTIDSPHVGELEVDLGYAAILDLQPGNSFIDDWDVEF